MLERDGRGLEVEFVDGALHKYLQQAAGCASGGSAIRRARRGPATSYLACARKSNGAVGLKGGDDRLVLPAADHWIAPLLGSCVGRSRRSNFRPARDVLLHAADLDRLHRTDPYYQNPKHHPQVRVRRSRPGVVRSIMENYTHVAVIETRGRASCLEGQARVPGDGEPLLRPVCSSASPARCASSAEAGDGAALTREFIIVEPGDELDESRASGRSPAPDAAPRPTASR